MKLGNARELNLEHALYALKLLGDTGEDAAKSQESESCAALVERLGAMCDALLDATATLSIDSLSL